MAVKFVPESGGSGAQQGKLQVTVKSARNLQAVHSDGTSNPFVKWYRTYYFIVLISRNAWKFIRQRAFLFLILFFIKKLNMCA